MQTVSEIQEIILNETGIKTSVKKGKGSVKDYITFSPMFQGGKYPEYPFEWRQQLRSKYPETIPETVFVSGTQIKLHISAITGEATQYKKERKPIAFEDMKVKEWGSKNSQMRLDKNAARYAKKLRGPNGDKIARYY